jgi:hypothetical protein
MTERVRVGVIGASRDLAGSSTYAVDVRAAARVDHNPLEDGLARRKQAEWLRENGLE